MMQILSPKAENEFFENIEDIINEEDCEESLMHESVQKPVTHKSSVNL